MRKSELNHVTFSCMNKCRQPFKWGGGNSLIKVGTDVRARALGISGVNFCSGIRFGRSILSGD